MAKTKKTKKEETSMTYTEWLRQSAIRVARVHFAIVLIYLVTIILYDAFDLITDQALLERWVVVSSMAAVTALLWYMARSFHRSRSSVYAGLLYAFIMLDIAFASFGVFTQRGMASRAVFLYVIPLVIAALLLRRAAIYATAIIAAAAYSLTAIWYYVANPSEGYRIELYGEVGFYSALFFIVAALLWDVVRSKNADAD